MRRFCLMNFLLLHSFPSVSSGHHHEEGFQELHHSGPAAVWPHIFAHSNAGDLPDMRGASTPQHPHTIQVWIQLLLCSPQWCWALTPFFIFQTSHPGSSLFYLVFIYPLSLFFLFFFFFFTVTVSSDPHRCNPVTLAGKDYSSDTDCWVSNWCFILCIHMWCSRERF